MLQGALPPPRISIVLPLLLLAGLVSQIHVMEYTAGNTVTIDCREGCNKSVNRDDISQITWKKYNNSHFLLFSKAQNQTFSNFSESFFQDPFILRITDAQPSDSGNYICGISSLSAGYCNPMFYINVSAGSHQGSHQTQNVLIYASSSAAAVVIIIIIIIAIVYWRICLKADKPPDKIHQTSPEIQQREEPVYDNADQDYCLRFNTLYETLGRTVEGSV